MAKYEDLKKSNTKKTTRQPKDLGAKRPIDRSDLAKVVGGATLNHNETFVETKKASIDKPRKQPKDLGAKRPIDKSDLAKVVGGATLNHNETFIEL